MSSVDTGQTQHSTTVSRDGAQPLKGLDYVSFISTCIDTASRRDGGRKPVEMTSIRQHPLPCDDDRVFHGPQNATMAPRLWLVARHQVRQGSLHQTVFCVDEILVMVLRGAGGASNYCARRQEPVYVGSAQTRTDLCR